MDLEQQNPYEGSSFDDYLREEGLYEKYHSQAIAKLRELREKKKAATEETSAETERPE